VAMECGRHILSIFPERFRPGSASHPVVVGRGPILLKQGILYIQLQTREVLQHVEVHMTSKCSFGQKRMDHKPVLCSQHRKNYWHFIVHDR